MNSIDKTGMKYDSAQQQSDSVRLPGSDTSELQHTTVQQLEIEQPGLLKRAAAWLFGFVVPTGNPGEFEEGQRQLQYDPAREVRPTYKQIRHSILSAARQKLAKSGRAVPVREPLENPKKIVFGDAAEQSQARFSKIVSFEKFNANLQVSFGRALANIRNSSEDKNPPYIIVGDPDPRSPKSTTWVVKLVSGQTKGFPAQGIIPRYSVQQYLREHPEVKNVILLDDGAYSGEQMVRTFKDISRDLDSDVNVHVVVPYMTNKAIKYLQTEGAAHAKKEPFFYNQERMLTYEELGHKVVDPEDLEGIAKIKTRTPTWMAHKAADVISTNYGEMEKVASMVPISPYKTKEKVLTDWDKNTKYYGITLDHQDLRRQQILKLESKIAENGLEKLISQESDLKWISGQVHFVQSDRGFFLVANKYISNLETEQLSLKIDKTPYTLGGPDGEYQVKIKEGDQFSLQTPDGKHTAKFQLKNGKLEIYSSEI